MYNLNEQDFDFFSEPLIGLSSEFSIINPTGDDYVWHWELLTPPQSPKGGVSTSSDDNDDCSNSDFLSNAEETVNNIDDCPCADCQCSRVQPTTNLSCLRHPKLIQDCMWWRSEDASDSERFETSRHSKPVNQQVHLLGNSPTVKRNESSISSATDSSQVFPFPISEVLQNSRVSSEQTSCESETECEDEIDVVTVPKSPMSEHSPAKPVIGTFERATANGRKSTQPCASRNRDTVSQSISVAQMHSYCLTSAPYSLPSSPDSQTSSGKRSSSSSSSSSSGRASPIHLTKKQRRSLDMNSIARHIGEKLRRNHHGYRRAASVYEEDGDKRTQHNSMERQRRISLTNNFQELRSNVPSLMNVAKAPKVTILAQAAEYVQQLQNQERDLQDKLRNELHRKKQLSNRLNFLKNSLQLR